MQFDKRLIQKHINIPKKQKVVFKVSFVSDEKSTNHVPKL